MARKFSPSGAASLRVAVDVRSLVEPEPRGFARYTRALVEHLAARESLDLVAVSDLSPTAELAVSTELVRGRSEVAREQVLLPRLLRRLRADVLVAPANRGLPLMSPCPTVLVLHDAVEWDRALVPRPRGKSAIRFAYSSVASLAGATLVVAVSAHAADEIERRLHVDRRRIRIVPEGPGERFGRQPTAGEIAASLERFGIRRPFILSVGGFDAKKDVSTLVRAFAQLPASETELLFAGSLAQGDGGVMALAAALGVADRVRLLGRVGDDELLALYRTCACFAFAGPREGFGLPVAEALAAGAPVVAAAAGAVPEVTAGAARLFAAGDPAAAAREIAAVLGSESERARLHAAGLARRSELSWSAAAAQFEDVLWEAANVTVAERATAALRALPAALRGMR